MPKPLDPLDVNGRLYRQIAELLTDMEDPGSQLTVRERIAGLVAIARIQTVFVGLRKEDKSDDNAGSAVRKYSAAFAKNATGRRAPRTRRRAATTPANNPVDDDWDDDDDES